MIKRILYVDGVASNRKAPDTFLIPAMLDKLSVDQYDLVKAGIYAGYDRKSDCERLWFEVIKNDHAKQLVTGLLVSHPVYTGGHGLKVGNTLEIPYYAILGTSQGHDDAD